MSSNLNQDLLMEFLEKIIQKRKESAMITAIEHGLMDQVAKMIDDAIFYFQDKGLPVKTSGGTVRYWLIRTDAKVSSYSSAMINVRFSFACSPAEIKGKIRLTKKEKEIVAELQKIWDKSVKYRYFYDYENFLDKAEDLSALTHNLICYYELTYSYDMQNFYRKEDLLAKHYNLSGLSDEPYNMSSTRDLVSLSDLFT